MNTQLKLNALTPAQVRIVAGLLSRHEDVIPTYNNGASLAPHWAPIVHCEGPSLFGLYTPTIPASLAARVLRAVADDYGHCDTCGRQFDEQGCTSDRTHTVAIP